MHERHEEITSRQLPADPSPMTYRLGAAWDRSYGFADPDSTRGISEQVRAELWLDIARVTDLGQGRPSPLPSHPIHLLAYETAGARGRPRASAAAAAALSRDDVTVLESNCFTVRTRSRPSLSAVLGSAGLWLATTDAEVDVFVVTRRMEDQEIERHGIGLVRLGTVALVSERFVAEVERLGLSGLEVGRNLLPYEWPWSTHR